MQNANPRGSAKGKCVEGAEVEMKPVNDIEMKTVEEEAPLPKGWAETVDEASGDVYYYNETTGVTSWKRPGGEAGDRAISAMTTSVDSVDNEAYT